MRPMQIFLTIALVSSAGHAAEGPTLSGSGGATIQATDIDTTLASTRNPNRIVEKPGNKVSFCPALSCVTSPSNDHQRASHLISSVTSDDGHSQEQSLAVTTTIGTGYAKVWAPSKAYSVGDNVKFQDSRNAVYRAVTAGTSAASGSGPSGKASSIADGSVRWEWVNDAAIDAKVGIYNEVNVIAGAGNSWAQSNNVALQAGVKPSFNINTEFDFSNNSGTDCTANFVNCYNLEINTLGDNKATIGVHVTGGKGSTYGSVWGVLLNGSHLASDADIEDDAGAPIALGFDASGRGSAGHSIAVIKNATSSPSFLVNTGAMSVATVNDVGSGPATLATTGSRTIADLVLGSSGPRAIQINGSRSSASIEDDTTSPTAFHPAGDYKLASIFDSGTAPVGLNLAGKYSQFQISGTGFAVSPTGAVKATGYAAGPTTGVSCAAGTVSLSTLTITNGIVTHC